MKRLFAALGVLTSALVAYGALNISTAPYAAGTNITADGVTGAYDSSEIGAAEVDWTVTITSQAGTTPTIDGFVEDSDDNVTFVEVPGTDFTQVNANTTFPAIETITYRCTKRYSRIRYDVGGTTPSFGGNVRASGRNG